MNKKIKSAAFIYLSQSGGGYYLSDDPGYNIQRRPALGLQYLCAVLERRNITTNIFDQTVIDFDFTTLLDGLKGYDLAGFYCSDSQEQKVKAYCRKIKEKLGIPVLVGGPNTLTNTSFLDYGCDIVVHGEGEVTIQQIVDYYNGSIGIEDVKGISYKNESGIITNRAQELIDNLDTLPFPDRSKVDINAYYDYFLFNTKTPYATMITSRGCIYNCSYCTSYKIWGCRYRKRSVDNVISEIDELVNKYNIRFISFQDDLFAISNSWIEEFCQKLSEKDYKLRWMAVLHPFSIPIERRRILRMMKDAGCVALSFGLQSAHPEILKTINRNPAEPEKLREFLAIANEIGLITLVFYIFGLPNDTNETIRTTIDYSLTCGSTLANHFTLSVLKGSELDRLYGSKKVCELSQEEIRKFTEYASRKFYTRPNNILKIAYLVLMNPGWLIKIIDKAPYLLARIGIGFKRRRTSEYVG